MKKERVLKLFEEAYQNNLSFMLFMVDLVKTDGKLLKICREDIRPFIDNLRDYADLEEVGKASDEEYIWKTCCKSLGNLKFYRFIDDNEEVVMEILLTHNDNVIDITDKEELSNQFLELYKATKTGGVFTVDINYDRVYKDDTDYEAYYPDHIYTPEEREEFFKVDLKDYEFEGEINKVHYSWTGWLKHWRDHKYYRFNYPDGSGHLEIVVAPLSEIVTEEEFDEHLDNTDIDHDILVDGLWIKK